MAILVAYGTFSTIFHEMKLVGGVGQMIGDANIYLFGYIAYISLIILFVPLYRVVKIKSKMRALEYYLGWLLLLIALLVVQFLLVDALSSGFLSREIAALLLPYVGKVGLFFFFLMMGLIAYVMILGDEFHFDKDEWMDKLQGWYFKSKTYLANHIKNPFKSPYDDATRLKRDKKRLARVKKDIPKASIIEEALVQRDIHAIGNIKTRDIEKPKRERINIPKTDETEPVEQNETTSPTPPQDLFAFEESTHQSEEQLSKQSGIVDELEENTKLLEALEKGEIQKPKNFRLPTVDFLQKPKKTSKRMSEAQIDKKIGELLNKLKEFKIEGDVYRTYTGPVVTTFEFRPAPNVKVSKILNLQDDLAMALKAETIRMQAPIPGRDVIGIEIPNSAFETIYLREIFESEIFQQSKSPLTLALGKDIVGKAFVTDLKKLPHLLIAGTTGSGKSVGINAMILSLLFKNDPDRLKMILIDPKMLEFSIYNDIPHLLTPVITEAKKAIAVLANMVVEMERRYKVMANSKTKNIENYNDKAKKEGWDEFPYIVIVIDELADLMMTGGKEVEFSIARLAQMARASGIHLIVATQRPSVDVVTGLIKANLPSRLSYKVGQRIDSKVILDTQGAESLLGRGDALFTPPGMTGIVRLHAPWNSEEEIEEIAEYLKAQREPEYDSKYLQMDDGKGEHSSDGGSSFEDLDPLYEDAKQIVLEEQKSSISYLQRRLQIGYNRSARIVEQLEVMGVLSPPNAKGNREIL
ncbi:MAG: DNA translocase FtsK [Campylobacterales bacterium]|nr:DNA translocase FtsK [Campylobacterales bacterium]